MEEKVDLSPVKKWLELSKKAFDVVTRNMTEEQKSPMREELLNHFRKVLETQKEDCTTGRI